jgi:hypothetical protein
VTYRDRSFTYLRLAALRARLLICVVARNTALRLALACCVRLPDMASRSPGSTASTYSRAGAPNVVPGSHAQAAQLRQALSRRARQEAGDRAGLAVGACRGVAGGYDAQGLRLPVPCSAEGPRPKGWRPKAGACATARRVCDGAARPIYIAGLRWPLCGVTDQSHVTGKGRSLRSPRGPVGDRMLLDAAAGSLRN